MNEWGAVRTVWLNCRLELSRRPRSPRGDAPENERDGAFRACKKKSVVAQSKMSPFAPNRNVPSGSGWWSAPSPSRLMMATPRDPSRVREAKPYGPALDCSLAVAKTALCSTRRRGSRAYGKRGHLYWATEGDISIELRHLQKKVLTYGFLGGIKGLIGYFRGSPRSPRGNRWWSPRGHRGCDVQS